MGRDPHAPRFFVDRDEALIELARGRRVLHLGCVGHTDLATEDRVRLAKRTLHWKLSQCAEVLGVDTAADVVADYRQQGLFDNILVGDVARLGELGLEPRFDLIVAADIIEHLSNPGAMLDGVAKLSGAETRLVVTTPHAFGLANFVRFLLGRFREGADHAATHNAQTLCNLLERHGFAIERLDTCHQAHARKSAFFTVGRALFRVIPKLGGTLLVVARWTRDQRDPTLRP